MTSTSGIHAALTEARAFIQGERDMVFECTVVHDAETGAPRTDRPTDPIDRAELERIDALLMRLSTALETGGWQPKVTVPTNGREFLALLTNGWRVILSATPAMTRQRYQWWRHESLSIPYEPSHPPLSETEAHRTLRIACWMDLPAIPTPTQMEALAQQNADEAGALKEKRARLEALEAGR
jgi:hypothetical protein